LTSAITALECEAFFLSHFLSFCSSLLFVQKIRKVELTTGEVINSREMKRQYFGEGLTIIDDKIYQLTYRKRKGFVYQKDEKMELVREFNYPPTISEGWGMTTDGYSLILDDGVGGKIRFWDPETFEEV